MMNSAMLTVMTVVIAAVVEVAAANCSSSCLVQQDIISCRRFDRPSNVRACIRHHPSASVLDLSYIDVRHPLTRRSLSGFRHIVVLYLDGSRIRRLDADALVGMRHLQMVFARRMRGPLTPLLEAVIAAPSIRQVALADNFVVCSCSWLRAVERLSAADVVIVDMLDTAPQCSDETVTRCRGTNHLTLTRKVGRIQLSRLFWNERINQSVPIYRVVQKSDNPVLILR